MNNLKSVENRKIKKDEKINEYNKNQKLCLNCQTPLKYDKKANKFCSKSCAASYNNKNRIVSDETKKKISNTLKQDKKELETKICECCQQEFTPRYKRQKHCSKSCTRQIHSLKAKKIWEDEDYRNKVINSMLRIWCEERDRFSIGEKHSKIIGKYTKGKYKDIINSIFDVSSRTASKILKRLNIKCCICGWDECTCDIHHINGKKVEDCDGHWNLTYICPNCHRLVHNGKINKDELKTLKEMLPDNWMDSYYG